MKYAYAQAVVVVGTVVVVIIVVLDGVVDNFQTKKKQLKLTLYHKNLHKVFFSL